MGLQARRPRLISFCFSAHSQPTYDVEYDTLVNAGWNRLPELLGCSPMYDIDRQRPTGVLDDPLSTFPGGTVPAALNWAS